MVLSSFGMKDSPATGAPSAGGSVVLRTIIDDALDVTLTLNPRISRHCTVPFRVRVRCIDRTSSVRRRVDVRKVDILSVQGFGDSKGQVNLDRLLTML
jgi:hypothetical protein